MEPPSNHHPTKHVTASYPPHAHHVTATTLRSRKAIKDIPADGIATHVVESSSDASMRSDRTSLAMPSPTSPPQMAAGGGGGAGAVEAEAWTEKAQSEGDVTAAVLRRVAAADVPTACAPAIGS